MTTGGMTRRGLTGAAGGGAITETQALLPSISIGTNPVLAKLTDQVRGLWARRDPGTAAKRVEVDLPPHGAGLYRLDN